MLLGILLGLFGSVQRGHRNQEPGRQGPQENVPFFIGLEADIVDDEYSAHDNDNDQ